MPSRSILIRTLATVANTCTIWAGGSGLNVVVVLNQNRTTAALLYRFK
jgi:hypothetical protein